MTELRRSWRSETAALRRYGPFTLPHWDEMKATDAAERRITGNAAMPADELLARVVRESKCRKQK